MPLHPALTPGRAAVITGAASGIGLAVAEKLAALGMKVCLSDIDGAALQMAAATVAKSARTAENVILVPADVSKAHDVERLKDSAYAAFGEVAFLMNNAGTGGSGGTVFGAPDRWRRILDVNLGASSTACRPLRPPCCAKARTAPLSTPARSRA